MFRHITELLPCNASLTAKLQTLLPLIQEFMKVRKRLNISVQKLEYHARFDELVYYEFYEANLTKI